MFSFSAEKNLVWKPFEYYWADYSRKKGKTRINNSANAVSGRE